MPHPLYLFIHWCTRACCHILATINNAAVNTGCIYLFKLVSFSLDEYPEMELLDHMVVLCLSFWGTSITFFIVVALIYNPTNGAQGFPFLHILSNTCYSLSFWPYTYFNRCEMMSYYGFWFVFPWWLGMPSIFSRAWWPPVCLLWENVCAYLCPFLNYIVLFLLLSCMSSLYILNINPLWDMRFVDIFCHSVGCFSFWWFPLLCFFSFDVLPFVYFCLCCLCF